MDRFLREFGGADPAHVRGKPLRRREAHMLNGELEKLRRNQGQAGSASLADVDDLLELR